MGKIDKILKVSICKAVVAAMIMQNPRFAIELRATSKRQIEHNVRSVGGFSQRKQVLMYLVLVERKFGFFSLW